MSVPLYIQPGSPNWWLSPGIYVTTVSDPTTKVTNPIAGSEYTVWVQVENFYPEADDSGWALFVCWLIPTSAPIPIASIPAGQILNGFISSAGPQGSPITVPIPAGTISSPAVVNLQAATTWTPAFENGGHECLIALVYNEQETGGPPISSVNYNAPWTQTYTLAQHNLSVLPMTQIRPHFQYPFRVYNEGDEERGFVLRAWQGPLSEIAGFLPGLPGGRHVLPHPGQGRAPGRRRLGQARCGRAARWTRGCAFHRDPPAERPGNERAGGLPEGDALIHVARSLGERVLSGLSVLVMAGEK